MTSKMLDPILEASHSLNDWQPPEDTRGLLLPGIERGYIVRREDFGREFVDIVLGTQSTVEENVPSPPYNQ